MKIHILSLALLLSAGLVSAQSGRRIAQPTPTPVRETADQTPQYSESTPAPTRRASALDRFPKIGDGVTNRPPQKTPSANNTADTADSDVVKITTDLITIPVSVYDRDGIYVSGLTKSDFKIFEDGKPQEIAYFGVSDKPFTVILMLDTSPSTEFKIEQIQAAARTFVDQLQPKDRVMVVEFNGSIHLLCDATSDREQIYKALNKTKFGGGTSLYDAVSFSLKKKLNSVDGRKAIVLFTDGVDTSSRKSTYDTSIDLAEEADTLIFPIYYNTFFSNPLGGINGGGLGFPGSSGPPAKGTQPEEYALGRQYLKELALYTGGRVFQSESTPGGLSAAFEGIADELRRQYNIGYVPETEGLPGQRKKIKVRVDRANVIVRSRDSYIVGSAQPTPQALPNDK